jgi:thiol-disulfide isomerase/thioredoxin
LVAGFLLIAATADVPGWTPGQVASSAQRVLDGAVPNGTTLELPDTLTVARPTVLVYFSPTCPHCQHAAPEIEALSKRIAKDADLVWVASGQARQGEVDEFAKTYHLTSRVVHDENGSIVEAIGARSTPSALFVKPTSKPGKVELVDLWFPYAPGYDFLIAGRVEGDLWKQFHEDEYQGDNVCGSCHKDELQSWQLTHHSVAWWSLVGKEKQRDPECNRCHVVGAGQPGGFDGRVDSDLVNVGCEACHGPGGPHDGKPTDARAACAGCHDAEHSISFSVDKGLPLIDHFRSTTLSPVDAEAIRRSLAAGTAPRPLLAFPEGETQGVEACRSCHPAEVASWSVSAHAGAMTQLKDEGHDDANCVKCHATALHSGPPPKDAAGFRTSESVGCESCHGPAQAHLAAGGHGGIEGLGQDCPVCVVEAICTSCHTPTWDPSWSLDAGLKVIAHHAATKP